MRTLGMLLLSAMVASAADPTVRDDEAKRIAVIEKVRPSVVAIFAAGGQGGGSGVLIDKDGYALTNFHVVQGSGPVMQCGLPDGILYDAVLVGLDKVGDVALIKLLPKTPGKPFPFAVMGDSDKVREGDWSLAMGNPFLLATDFTPTVTFGLVSGVNRYQYPEGTLLEYTDCIQIDTSINPGNSGGPLFNMNAELIGINGRGSFDKRRRINSGVGYAISINQIKNFLGHLRAGLDTDHATLGARVTSASEEIQKLEIRELLEDADAFRRGLDVGDELISFAGRPLSTTNQYKNVLGIFPRDWRMPLVYRRGNQRKEILVRLQGLMTKDQMEDPNRPKPKPEPGQPPMPMPEPPKPKVDSPASKLYVAKKGFANYYFNEQEQNRLFAAFLKHGDFTAKKGNWTIEAEMELKTRKTTAKMEVLEPKSDEKDAHTTIKVDLDGNRYSLDPLKSNLTLDEMRQPKGSGGLMLALYHYRLLLTQGLKGFRNPTHGGREPFYLPPSDPAATTGFKERRVDAEVLRTEHASVGAKWYFSTTDQKLMGFEVFPAEKEDPCGVYLSDYKPTEGGQLPHRIEVRFADERYAVFQITKYELK